MLFFLFMLFAGPQTVELTVRPLAATTGATVHVMCRIPRREENRSISFGLEGRLSTRQIDGMDGPITFQKYINDVGCPSPQVARCELTDNFGKKITRLQEVKIIGCPEDSDDDPFQANN